MQTDSQTSLPTGKDIRTIAGTAECYQPLLTELALQLGIGKEEVQAMVALVVEKGSSSFLLQKEGYTLKAWLAKILVRDCVFKLCSAWFSGRKDGNALLRNADSIWIYSEPTALSLSAKLVYILCDVAQFDECEVAKIVNSSCARVKGELAKARCIVRRPVGFIVSYRD